MREMPVEKLRLRPWLEHTLDSERIPGVAWVERKEKIFKVSWKHASRHGWTLDEDACIFKEWAVHTGRFREGPDTPDPRRWKANFRCALNALPDIKELQARAVTRGNNAYKVYQMIALKKAPKKEEKGATKNSKSKAHHGPSNKNFDKNAQRKHTLSSRETPTVWKRRSVIQKASKLKEPISPLPIVTSQPIKHRFFTYWPTFPAFAHAHLKDHDYLTTWYDPRPEMKDIGVMTYQMQDVKQEPLSPAEQQMCCGDYDQNISEVEVTTDTEDYMSAAKEEKAVPSDEEIIDLVDRMSRDSDSMSHRSDSVSSYEDFEADIADQEPLSPVSTKSPRRPRLSLKTHDVIALGCSEDAPTPPPLTPNSTSEILKGFAAPVSQE